MPTAPMLDDSALRQFRPVIVTPTHDGKCFEAYVLSMLNLVADCQLRNIPLQVLMHKGESLITRARNNCVATFLENPHWTHLCWIDADIGFSTEAFYRLLRSGYDVAAGIYPLKRSNWPVHGVATGMTEAQFDAHYMRYTVNTGASADGKVHIAIQPDGFFKVREAPTGFMVIRREVFSRLIAAYPDLRYTPDDIGSEDKGLHYRFFDVMVDPQTRRYLSEDYGFCRLWEAIGGEIHVDAQSQLVHEGYRSYRGNFPASLQTNLAYAVGADKGCPMSVEGVEYLAAETAAPLGTSDIERPSDQSES